MEITEKEFAVIQEISSRKQSSPTQRKIANKLGISLGLTNLIIKRLIKKGYIKIQEVPPRTIIYTLTPKGLVEKSRKSYHFISGTIDLIRRVKKSIQDIVIREYEQGGREFRIYFNSELSLIFETAVQGLNLKDVRCFGAPDNLDIDEHGCCIGVINNGKEKRIDLILELANQGDYY